MTSLPQPLAKVSTVTTLRDDKVHSRCTKVFTGGCISAGAWPLVPETTEKVLEIDFWNQTIFNAKNAQRRKSSTE